MKELHFDYHMKLSFDKPVEKHRFTLKCIPRSDQRQIISDLRVEIFPKEFLSFSEDSFGNSRIYGYSEGKHGHFSARVTGRARTGLSSWKSAGEDYQTGLYKYQTDYTNPGPALMAFAGHFSFSPETSGFDKALSFMKELYKHFQYEPGVTDIHTTAEQAMSLGRGVCQDYSHILLSLCRMEKIPARYVVGMLMGEGQSHAWVEICSDRRWYALDPTNNLIVDDQHICISKGRDYKDCIINQGVFTGKTRQLQEIRITVTESGPGSFRQNREELHD